MEEFSTALQFSLIKGVSMVSTEFERILTGGRNKIETPIQRLNQREVSQVLTKEALSCLNR